MSHITYYIPEYELTDQIYKPDEVGPEVPLYKKALCGDNLFGNIFYPLWRDLDCVCCSFFRGVLTGAAIMLIANILEHMVF